MNRRKFFSFIATAPVASVIGAKAALDANGNDVAPLMRGDFLQEKWWLEYQLRFERDSNELLRSLLQKTANDRRFKGFGS